MIWIQRLWVGGGFQSESAVSLFPFPAVSHFRRRREKERRFLSLMESERIAGEDRDMDGEFDSVREVSRDRFRLSSISIANAQARRSGSEISEPVVACLADLAFQFSEQLAKDLERFAHHAGRKSVNTDDVILSSTLAAPPSRFFQLLVLIYCRVAAHRNEHLAVSLRSFCDELKLKEPQSLKKRKRLPAKEAKATTSAVHISDL
ncbi:protein MHF1 homolog isoform X1 [Eucalyptus grandis]|uniref:protein MHF1 homolog isoform X1 n=1 Tax=Eucalyptus grandis TaxID=71139 RepID=UPI00192E8B00|nr:protein MHF1 homolog isoform X1 [Eucalyptus grandis]